MTDFKARLTSAGESFLKEWLSDSAYVEAHTSGSTGTPKSIRLPKSDMKVSARATNRFFNIGKDSLLVCPLSADYIAGKMMIVRAVEAGCRLVMLEPSNHLAPEIDRVVEEHGSIDLLPLVPSQCESLGNLRNGAIRNIIVGGAPVSPDMEERLAAYPADVWATYGMTETCSHVALRPMGSLLYKAMPGISFYAGDDGRLTIDAPEYSFRTLTTNDIVEIADPQTFRWLGRADNVVNSGGVKLFPEQLERRLAGHIAVPFYLKGEEDSKWGTRLVLVAECAESEADALADICAAVLDAYSRPKEIRCVASLPRTSNGKIRRI